MKYLLAATTFFLTLGTQAKAEEIKVMNENGDVEIYIQKEANGTSETYVSSGINAEPQTQGSDEIVVQTQAKPTIKVLAPVGTATTETTTSTDATAQETAPAPTINLQNYQKMIDAGGNYDNSEDVYHPKVQMPN